MSSHEVKQTLQTEIQQPELLAQADAERRNQANASYAESMLQISANIPEIAEKIDVLHETGSEIIGQFDIEPALFDNPARTIVFASIVNRWHENKTQAGEAAQKEQDFLLDSLTLVAHEYSPQFAQFKSDIEGPASIDEVRKVAVYDQYTNKQVTQEINEAIASGLLGGVKERLGITDDNEDPYDVRILTIDPKGQTSYGLNGPSLPMYEDIPGDYHEKAKVIDAHSKDRKLAKDWQDGLQERTITMARDLGTEDVFGAAWVTELDGKTTLCLAQATAEKILHPELTESTKYYKEDDLARDMATLEHEYTHTQGGLNIDKNILFGINVEEVRAEYFSGNKMGYQDVKGLFQDVRILTGVSVVDYFDGKVKGGTTEEMYTHFVNALDLNTTLELLQAAPQNYAKDQSNRFQSEIIEYIGGFDGVLGRILEKQIMAGKADDVEERVSARAAHWLKVVPQDYQGVANQRKNMYGLNVVTDLVLERANKLNQAA